MLGLVIIDSEVSAATLSGLLTMLTSILSSAVGWVSTVGTTVAGNPLILLGVVLPFVGFGVGLFKRLLSL